MAWLQNVFWNFVCNILSFIPVVLSFSDGSESIWGGKEIHLPVQETWVRSLGWGMILWRRRWKPTPLFLLGTPMDRGTRWAIVRGVTKSLTWLSDWAHTSGPDSYLATVNNRDHKIVICTILNKLNCLSSKHSDLLAVCSTISKVLKLEGQLWL